MISDLTKLEWAARIWRILLAIFVIYGFTIILMTAAAQQSVIASLAASDADLGYSSAFIKSREVEKNAPRVEALKAEDKRLSAEFDQGELELNQAQRASTEAWTEFMDVARKLETAGLCDATTSDDPVQIWTWFRQCVAVSDLSDADRPIIEEVMNRTPNALQLHRAREAQESGVQRIYSRRETVRAGIAQAVDEAAAGVIYHKAFDETAVMRSLWLGGGAFIAFPPVLLQILLALSAGAFGALLLTLILIVYPKNRFDFSSGQGFEARIVLGGLIAVCVYVILGGSASILGNSTGAGAGSANVMTFCATGILAGMFSDRVASWLSDKADVFLTKGAAAPPPPPLPS